MMYKRLPESSHHQSRRRNYPSQAKIEWVIARRHLEKDGFNCRPIVYYMLYYTGIILYHFWFRAFALYSVPVPIPRWMRVRIGVVTGGK